MALQYKQLMATGLPQAQRCACLHDPGLQRNELALQHEQLMAEHSAAVAPLLDSLRQEVIEKR